MSQKRRGVKFLSGADPPPEVVSEAQYCQTELVWMDKLAARIEGVLVWQSDNYPDPSLN